MTELPIVGAAMTLKDVEINRNWLLEKPRDLELQDFVPAEVLAGDWQSVVDHARRLLDGHQGRLGMHGPFMGLNVASSDPDVQAVVAKRMDQALDVAAALNVTQIVIHSPYSTWMHNNLDNWPEQRQRVFELTHATLDAAVKRAENQGCVFVLENIEDKDPADRRKLVESFNSSAFALSIDTGHAAYAYGSTGAPPVDYFVLDAGEKLQHVHLQDADGYADRHWPLGHGNINWRAIFARLADITSHPRLIIEIRDKSQIQASAAHLAALGLAQ
ncbi:sugar phosphate isomerase/epimerase family protein [Devosia beringensis]|uniref:sugar phosphate isomerase/epimerase family protein n=1 Tax=Devosia beringensis TaxID=2657486 RepID=UPI00186B88D3|nr:sugar phosphate isomerase/epimerase family protein [Devosia beringensis]